MSDVATGLSLRELYFTLAQALAVEGRDTDAAGAFQSALKERGDRPSQSDVWVQLAEANLRMGLRAQAFSAYVEAIASAPSRISELIQRAHELVTGEIAHSAEPYVVGTWLPRLRQAGLSAADAATAAVFGGRIAMYARDYRTALTCFQEAESGVPESPRALEGLGEAIWKSGGDRSVALATLQHAKARANDVDRARLAPIGAKIIKLLSELGRYREALDELSQRKVDDDPFHADLCVAEATARLATKDAAGALRAADQAVALAPNWITAHELRGASLIALGQHAEAVAEANNAFSISPTHAGFVLMKAQALIEGVLDVDLGRQMLGRFVTLSNASDPYGVELPTPTGWEGNRAYFEAELAAAQGNADGALARVDQAIDAGIEATDAFALELRAGLLEKLGRQAEAAEALISAANRFMDRLAWGKAVGLLEHSARLDRSARVHWYWSDAVRGSAYNQSTGQSDRTTVANAMGIWRDGFAIAPPDAASAWAYVVPARCLEEGALPEERVPSRWWEAVAYTEQSLMLNETNYQAWTYLARFLRNLARDPAAMLAVMRAMELQPADSFVLSEAIILFTNEGDPAAAELVDRYQAALPTPDAWGYGVKTLALSTYGHFDAALQASEEGLRQAPDDMFLLMTRGRILTLRGRRTEAQECLRRAVELPASAPNLLQAYSHYYLGAYDAASALFREFAAAGAEDPWDVRSGLALCILASGEAGAARRELEEAFEFMRSRRQARELVQDFDELSTRPEVAARADALAAIAELRAQTERRRQELDAMVVDAAAAAADLRSSEHDVTIEPNTMPWVGFEASLARLAAAQGLSAEAAERYERLSRSGLVPPAAEKLSALRAQAKST